MKRCYSILFIVLLALIKLSLTGCKKEQTAAPVTPGVIKIGINGPLSGGLANLGQEAVNGGLLAVMQINAAGGILGHPVELVVRDGKGDLDTARANVYDLINNEGVKMFTHIATSQIAFALAKVALEKKVLFMTPNTYSPMLTAEEGNRYCFRTSLNSTMQARAIASYLNRQYKGKKYFYITYDYVWGTGNEEVLRRFTGTEDRRTHKGVLVSFPSPSIKEIKKAVRSAQAASCDILVLNLFGEPLNLAIKETVDSGLKKKAKILISVALHEKAIQRYGTFIFEDIISSSFFEPQVPFKYDYERGKEFVFDYIRRFGNAPSLASAGMYTSVFQYKEAVERAGTFEVDKVIRALEGFEFELLKGKEKWRAFDHQNVQDVYIIKFKSPGEIHKTGRFKGDYWNVLRSEPGEDIVRSFDEWKKVMEAAGKPCYLEPLFENE